jgi:hypothetical protein
LSKIDPSVRDKFFDQMQWPSILLQHSLNVLDQFEFCRLHEAENYIVPNGLKKNYPITIDFDSLPKRVDNLIPELSLIIKGERKSYYRDIALSTYHELGKSRARIPSILMGRFEQFLVSIFNFFVSLSYYLFIKKFSAWLLWIQRCFYNIILPRISLFGYKYSHI